jgi:hypothetical protein
MRRLTPGTISSAASALVVLSLLARLPAAALAQGMLQQMRDDVRGESSGSSSGSSPRDSDDDDDDDDHHGHYYDDEDEDDGGFYGFVFIHSARAAFYTVTSPFWAPRAALDDNWFTGVCFPRHPYGGVPGYLIRDRWERDPDCASGSQMTLVWPARPRTWAARLRMEYADEFNDVERVSGHLLLSTSSRFGLDTETSYYQEQLPGGGSDHLWLGDCNLTFRFAQGEHAQFRTGLGFNWLDDPIETDFGFNFTYGADLFPCRPWVLSATIDWGTLGEAELFRFRTTAGVVLYGVEVYTGYEYLDIDTTQMNGLIGGVRIWF